VGAAFVVAGGQGTRLGYDGPKGTYPVTPVRGKSLFQDQQGAYMFGRFGGRYIPETLVQAHEELFQAWQQAWADPEYHAELKRLRKDYVGGPTPLWLCKRLTEHCGACDGLRHKVMAPRLMPSSEAGGASIWLKREDLAHTGAHKINNALGQVGSPSNPLGFPVCARC
jgi:tryptophan synthase beta subunit